MLSAHYDPQNRPQSDVERKNPRIDILKAREPFRAALMLLSLRNPNGEFSDAHSIANTMSELTHCFRLVAIKIIRDKWELSHHEIPDAMLRYVNNLAASLNIESRAALRIPVAESLVSFANYGSE